MGNASPGYQGLALQTLSWDKNWDSHSLGNGYPSFYHRIALVAPSPDIDAVQWDDFSRSCKGNVRHSSQFSENKIDNCMLESSAFFVVPTIF